MPAGPVRPSGGIRIDDDHTDPARSLGDDDTALAREIPDDDTALAREIPDDDTALARAIPGEHQPDAPGGEDDTALVREIPGDDDGPGGVDGLGGFGGFDDTALAREIPGDDDTQPAAPTLSRRLAQQAKPTQGGSGDDDNTPPAGGPPTPPAAGGASGGGAAAASSAVPSATDPGESSGSRRMQTLAGLGMPVRVTAATPVVPTPLAGVGAGASVRWPAPAATAHRPRVIVANRGGGGILYWLARLYAFAGLVIVAAFGVGAVTLYSYFSVNAPPVPDLERYAHVTPGLTRIYAADGTVIGQYAKEWRQIVPFERIPRRIVDAFLAVEDHDFFEHRGIYFKGIARAVWRNLTAGDFAQGGSTITQQVAKQFLGSEKSLSRKGKEAVIARRLEARYSKRAILAVYLNHIYLGAGAWGVSAAARRYFDKDLDQLTLAEAALIAGLAKAPSKYSPQNQPKLALDRRNVVLDKMAGYGLAPEADVTAAKAEPIHLDLQHVTYADRMPYYGTYVRNGLVARLGDEELRARGLQVAPEKLADVRRALGEEALGERGLQIETAAEPVWEAAAYDSADYGARNQDKRQGWRGPEWRVDGPARELFVSRQKQLYGKGPLVPGKRYLALVDKVAAESAEVIIGDRRLQLPLRTMKWASKWQPGNAENDVQIEAATAALRPGFVIWVRREQRSVQQYRSYTAGDKNPVWLPPDDQQKWDDAHADVVRLEQVPHPQTAIFTADHRTAYVAAMVGGHDYDRSVFNRAVQACRQPGSTYKPIYYSLALDQGYGFDTRLNDIPVTITDPVTGEKWTPTNLDDTLDNDVTLEFALVFSKNVPSVDLFMRLKARNVEAWARRLGFSTKIYADDALALGASCSKLDELARAFTVFARNGAWWPRPAGKEKSWVYVRRILDRAGNVLEDNTVAEDPQLPAGNRLDRVAALAGVVAPQAIPARAAYLMSKLLANEVTYGFASVLRETKLVAAGKTGTSSATHDTTFVAYTSQWTTLVWMGDDKKERALGRSDAAYITVVPLWTRYMHDAARGYPNQTIPWAVPPGVKPNDRGDHTKGEKVPPMDLIWKVPQKPDASGDGLPPV
jgi:penicillin-binding protein 1A